MRWNVICEVYEEDTNRLLKSAVVDGPFKTHTYAELLAGRYAARHQPVKPSKGAHRLHQCGWVCRDEADPGVLLVYGIHGVRARRSKPKPAVRGRRADIETINSGLVVAMRAFGGELPAPNDELQRRISDLLAYRCPGWDLVMDEDGRPKRLEALTSDISRNRAGT